MSTPSIKREARGVQGAARLEFEAVYRENVRPVTAFFARRCRDPQHVADLASQTFVEAIRFANTFQGRGTPTAWLIAIARRVYANHLADQAMGADLIDQLSGQLVLADDEVDDLAERIDAQRKHMGPRSARRYWQALPMPRPPARSAMAAATPARRSARASWSRGRCGQPPCFASRADVVVKR